MTARASGWWTRASCRGEDPELFFPVGTDESARRQLAEAKQVCHRCPVLAQCLTDALEHDDEGVRGGLSTEERRALHRRPVHRLNRAGSLEPLPDAVMVDLIVQHGPQPGATREETALAAVRLVAGGRSLSGTASHVHASNPTVARWVARAAAGEPLIQGSHELTNRPAGRSLRPAS